jgi:hypothetical protein
MKGRRNIHRQDERLIIIIIQVQLPNGYYQIKDQGSGSGDYSFTAPQDGRYEYCFSNEAWASYTKEVAFNVHGVVYVPASDITADPLENAGTSLLCTPLMPRAMQMKEAWIQSS